MIQLGADIETLQQFQELRKEDIKASTAILTPNIPGSTTLQLSWIWKDTTGQIIGHVNPVGVTSEIHAGSLATIAKCESALLCQYD